MPPAFFRSDWNCSPERANGVINRPSTWLSRIFLRSFIDRSLAFPMAYLRAAAVFSMLIAFFVVGAPVQWLILRLSLPGAQMLPLLFNRMLLYFLQIRVVVRGGSAEGCGPEALLPQLLVANHVSWTDIPALGTLHSISFLAKREVAGWPIIATFARLQRTVFVDRESRKSIREANAAMAAAHAGRRLGRAVSGRHDHGRQRARALPFLAFRRRARSARCRAACRSRACAAGCDPLFLGPCGLARRRSSAAACWSRSSKARRSPANSSFRAPLLFDRTSDRKAIAQECTQKIAAMLAATGAAGATVDHFATTTAAPLPVSEAIREEVR